MLLFNLSAGLLLAAILLIPLVIKWELDKALAFPAVLLIGLFAGLAQTAFGTAWAIPWWCALCLQGILIVVTAAALLLWRFFRDPERTCVPPERCVLSAADGRVVYVKKFDSGQIPVSEKNGARFALKEFTETDRLPASGWLIGISMSYLDVHVNRAPVDGKVVFLKHIGGFFHSLKHAESVFQNERVSTVIEHPDLTVGMVQIASRLVRNIIPFVREGDAVRQGQRVGKIRFGSQVDLILPDLPGLQITVNPGDKLKAGLSVIARY